MNWKQFSKRRSKRTLNVLIENITRIYDAKTQAALDEEYMYGYGEPLEMNDAVEEKKPIY